MSRLKYIAPIIIFTSVSCKTELINEAASTASSTDTTATATGDNCGYYAPSDEITQIPGEGLSSDFTEDSSTSFSQTATEGQCFNTATIDLGSDFKTANICTGKNIFGRPGAAGCVDGSAAGTAAAAGDVLQGTAVYSSTGTAVTGTLTNQGSWNIETTAFPGAGYFSGIANTLNATNFCDSTSFLSIPGSANCDSYGDLHASNAYRNDFAAAETGGFPSDRPGATLAQEATSNTTYISGHNIIPDPLVDNNHWFDSAGGYLVDEQGHPDTSCGSSGTIAARIADCAARNGAQATWEGSKYGQAGESTWRLVTALEADASFTIQPDGTTCSGDTTRNSSFDTDCHEVWQDTRTGLLWTDMAYMTYNWYQATGYSSNADTTGVTGTQGQAGTGTDCNRAEVTRLWTVADVGSSLHQRYFVLNDSNESVGVWFDVGALNPGPPAAGLDRYIEVDIAVSATATAVAIAIDTAVDADLDFSVSRSSNQVTITDANNGERTDSTAGDSGFVMIMRDQGGSSCQPTIPLSACAPEELLDGANGVADYANLEDTYSHHLYFKGQLGYNSTPRVVWRLPTVRDWMTAEVNGLSKVHRVIAPDGGVSYWLADSSDATNSQAWYFNGTGATVSYGTRTTNRRVVCVGSVE